MCKAVEIGKHIMNQCINDGYDVTPSKIQKLLYYMQGEYLVNYNKRMFEEEIVAWECGPAIKAVNYYFTKFLFDNKDKLITANLFLSDEEKRVFEDVYDDKAYLTTDHLIEMTQTEEPWVITYDQGRGRNKPITDEMLKNYFGGTINGLEGLDK